ncbi:MAG: sulfite exporter TauE/SafE family protein [Waddliaceae bacterium]
MEILYITLLTIVATCVGTLTGFGTSTIMVPVLLLFFPIAPTLLFVGIIHWFGNIWKIAFFKEGVRWSLIFSFGISGVILSFLGARLVFSVSNALLSQVLGGFLILYVVFLFFNPSFKFKQNTLTAATGGAFSGFFAGIFGVGGAIRGAFLSVFDLPKAVYIATSGAIGLVIDTTRIITYVNEGATIPSHLTFGLLIFIPASFLGAQLAKKIVHRIPQNQFRMVIALFLLLIGFKMVLF